VTPGDVVTLALVTAGAAFFVAGAVGLLRFPDTFSRLHALTKVDNLGLGLVSAGIALQMTSPLQWLKVLFVWLLVMLTGAVASQLIAQHARREQDR